MVKCPNCGYEMDKAVNYCPYCGEPVNAEELEDSSQPQSDSSKTFAGNNDAKTIADKAKGVTFINGLYEYPKASLSKRFGAFLIDILILFILSIPSLFFFIMGAFFSPNRDYFDENSFSGTTIMQGVFSFWGFMLLFLPLIYFLIKDGLKNGQSFGKRIVGLTVIDIERNTPCKVGRSMFRNFVSLLIISVPFVNLLTMWVEPIMVLVTDSGKKAADYVAKTQVIESSLLKS